MNKSDGQNQPKMILQILCCEKLSHLMNQATTQRIRVQRPLITPKITAIGYGNPRYNSMIAYKSGILLTVGSHLRWVDVENDAVLFDKQIGSSQIFQLMENSRYILIVNFDGLISLLNRDSLEVEHQFYAPGKEIRHSCLTDWEKGNYLAVSCELNDQNEGTVLAVYSLEDIESGRYEAIRQIKGYFYYPEYVGKSLTVIQYDDPNPKGRKRKETVMNKKLPVTNRVVKFTEDFVKAYNYDIKMEGEIICASQNKGVIYYLHNNKKLTVFDVKQQKVVELQFESKHYPLLVEIYEKGVIFTNSTNIFSSLYYDFDKNLPVYQKIQIKSQAVGCNHALKFSHNGFYSLNETGLHFYNQLTNKTHTQALFSITNCGLSFNQKGDQIAVADFGGSLHVFSIEDISIVPQPLFTVFVGAPIRSIAWCSATNSIAIGCVGGGFFIWRYGEPQADFVTQVDHTINILRALDSKIYAGVSDGSIKIFDSETMGIVFQFKAHHPIHYTTEEERELFGSMKNYAEIWSLTISPDKNNFVIISSSEDQTEKVFDVDSNGKKFSQKYHLKGHELAVTSIDWKVMDQRIGELYVSCSDDKIVRFRDPKRDFQILFEIETSTIKQWHTLTYLALEPRGTRVAVGSQNGYLFIYDILKRELQFGEKIHLGGIQGLQWKNGKIITCSSDLCLNILEV